MGTIDIYDRIFKEYKVENPLAINDIVNWYPSDDLEITVEYRDGRKMIYDSLFKTTKCAKIPDEAKDPILEEEEWLNAFSRRLYRKMKLSGLDESSLSRKTGISVVTINKYMNGKTVPNVYNIKKLASALNCSISYLVIE